jgi:uncharacterized membrane protein YhiD involved in acid resistance
VDPTILGLLPTGGVATVLVIVIVYLLRQNHADRKQYRDDVAAIEARHAADKAKRDEEMKASNAAVQQELSGLRSQVKEALAELESERRKRWAAEDVAAEERRLREELQRRLDERLEREGRST